jgi:hypothetical protein
MNYETTLESMMEARSIGLAPIGPEPDIQLYSEQGSADSGSKPDPEIDQFTHRGRSSANKISNRAAIVPAISPIDRTGVSFTPRDATNSELEGEAGSASALAQREPNGDIGLLSPSSKFQSGSSRLNELDRDLPPDNSERVYPLGYIAPFSFSLMTKVPTAIADLDNRQRSEGKRHEHPWFTDTWSGHERVH